MSTHLNAILDNIYNKEIKRGDMFWANIPHDPLNPHAQHGMRPVLVVSNDMCNKHSPAIIVLPLTTSKDKYYYIHPPIIGQDNRKSYALTEQPKVLEKDRLGTFIRHATYSEMVKLDEALLLSLGMISYLERINELENELTVLRNKVPEVKIEREIVEVPRQIDEDALNIGTHVKGILEIMMKSYNLQLDVRSQNTYSTDSGVSDINVDKDLENTDFISNSTTAEKEIITTADSTTCNELHKDKNKKKVDNKPLSQIDKFNKRYQTYLNDQSHSKKSESDVSESDSTVSHESKSHRSKPKGRTNRREEHDLSDVKQRPNAHKWTQERIKEFIQDCQSKKMTDEEIGNKYGITQHTVKGYFYKLKSKVW